MSLFRSIPNVMALAGSLLVCAAVATAQPVRFVDDDAPPGGDGLNWSTAYKCLQDALFEATGNTNITEIRVAQGTYKPDQDEGGHVAPGDREATFRLVNNVAIRGGYAGLTGLDPDARDIVSFETLLSGDLNGDDVELPDASILQFEPSRDENSYHVVTGSHTDMTAILEGMTMVAGNADGNHPATAGGGATIVSGSPRLVDCIFRRNTANLGGGLFTSGDSPRLTRCEFRENSAGTAGGVYCGYAGAELDQCLFVSNRAGAGGATVSDDSGTLTVTDCRYVGNRAIIGGAHYHEFSTNRLRFVNCLFSGNSASAGGGIYSGDGFITLTQCTFARNQGGGLFAISSGPRINNCVFWENEFDEQTDEIAQVGYVSGFINYSCVQGWTGDLGGAGNLGDDPMFVDADGPDNIIGTEDDNLHLRFDSPCVDAGDNDADTDGFMPGVQPLPEFDLDGNPRFADDPDTPDTGNPGAAGPPIVDMGAYEGPQQGFVVDAEALDVPEGGTATFTVALAGDPGEEVSVAISRVSGDSDIAVSIGASLTFDSGNYFAPQSVTLNAANDVDFTNGSAAIQIAAKGIAPADVVATEQDNEPVPALLYVDKNAAGANVGTSWPHAFHELRDAIDAAANRPGVAEIWVAQGTYTPAPPNGDRSASFELIKGVDTYGGFIGGETSREYRDHTKNSTILSGDLNGDDGPDFVNNTENSVHVVMARDFGNVAILDGFTITGGNAQSIADGNEGGGLYSSAASPRIANCVFRENRSRTNGGGLFNECGYSLRVTDCDFIGNVARDGGGIYSYCLTPGQLMTNTRFLGNTASENGGGMSNGTDGVTLVNCEFIGNTAKRGGGLATGDSSTGGNRLPLLVNCSFTQNLGTGFQSTARGGAIRNFSSHEVSVLNCILWNNQDAFGQGEKSQLSGPFTIKHSCIQGWTGDLGGIGNVGDDPLFVDADGMDDLLGTEDDDLRLSSGSPCIDAGDSGALLADAPDLDNDGDTTESTPFDLSELRRTVDDPETNDTGGGDCPIVDMGAHEFDAFVDFDGDTVDNGCDNCPFNVNIKQLDSDADGVGDLCDNCPGESNTGQMDSDFDGVGDACDNCVVAPNQGQGDDDNDGVGNACDLCPGFDDIIDSDSDGIPDGCDPCSSRATADTNGDGSVDGRDTAAFVRILINGSLIFDDLCAADANLDGVVNEQDIDPFVSSVVTAESG
ncbi:MAG: hypothetical protein MI923_07705 [Phycisphaerales bacterium]|nr:hypothetical protein [Phycisphaerales bacterium]